MIGVKIEIRSADTMKYLGNLQKKMPNMVSRTTYSLAKLISTSMKREAFRKRSSLMTTDRRRAIANIRAVRKSRYISYVTMPMGLHYLDTMRPHYVPARIVNRWVIKYFKGRHVSGMSHVTKRGRSASGALYVMPMPFTRRALWSVKKHMANELKLNVRRVLKKGY
jgi:hypothetical protein